MNQIQAYPDSAGHPVISIVQGVDRDVERSEDILMLGYAMVLSAPIFAPIAPPYVLLPLMALSFVVSVCLARRNFHDIRRKLSVSLNPLLAHDSAILRPLTEVFAEHPKQTLTDGFNPAKNIKRTLKSTLGSLMINPFWMPIFYALGLQFAEEKQVALLNKAVCQVEQKTAAWNKDSP